jgi:hypothetical protein
VIYFLILFFSGPPFVNRDDRHLLAHAMASDFSVAWQCLSKRIIGFLLRIKLHALIDFANSFGKMHWWRGLDTVLSYQPAGI